MQRSKLFSCLILAAAFLTGSASADILLPGERLFPQAVTATRDGALYVGIGKHRGGSSVPVGNLIRA